MTQDPRQQSLFFDQAPAAADPLTAEKILAPSRDARKATLPAPARRSITEEAAAIRASTDRNELSALLAALPAAADIEPIKGYDTSFFTQKLPADRAKRARALREAIIENQKFLADRSSRYEDIRSRGPEALSDYDLSLWYSSENPLGGLWCAIRILTGNITYARSMIADLSQDLAMLDLIPA